MYILVSGGFDPLHSGHINMFKAATRIGKLLVAVNSDDFLIRKKGTFLLPRQERAHIISNLTSVFSVYERWADTDDSTVDIINKFRLEFPNDVLFFGNGGDVVESKAKLLEAEACKTNNIYRLYGLGGGKTASSSDFYADSLLRMK